MMKIAVPASDTAPAAPIEARFARAPYFLVFDVECGMWEIVENTQVLNAVQGAGIQAAETLVRHQVTALLTTHCGPKAFRALQAAGITVYIGITGAIDQAVQLLRAGAFQPANGPDVEGHW